MTSRSEEEKFGVCSPIPNSWPPVNEYNCVDYFASTLFYDQECNNEELKRQHKPLESLVKLRGLEFFPLPNLPPPLFVIAKQVRLDEDSANKRGLFYFCHNTVYQSPNVRELCLKRLRTACEHFGQAVGTSVMCHHQGNTHATRNDISPRSSKKKMSKEARVLARKKKRQNFEIMERAMISTLKHLE